MARHFDCDGRLAEEGIVNEGRCLRSVLSDAYFASSAIQKVLAKNASIWLDKNRLAALPRLKLASDQRTLLQLNGGSVLLQQMAQIGGVTVYVCARALNPVGCARTCLGAA